MAVDSRSRARALLTAVLVLAACGVALRVTAQAAEPCVYRDARGEMVITDSTADPRCAHLRPKASNAPFRAPSRLTLTFAAAEMLSLTHQTATRHGIDHRLVESLVEMESGFDPRAVSPKGAMGLMQLMPAVAREYGIAEPFDPWQNLDAGVRYLRDLLHRFDGDIASALAAYNAGSGAVQRYDGIPPYPETRDYVRRVLYRYRQRVEEAPLH